LNGGNINATILWQTVWWFLNKLSLRLPDDPAIPLLGRYPEELKQERINTCTPTFAAALVTIAIKWK
jgi:hypothetical protein